MINTNHDHHFGPKHEESYIKWEGTKGAVKAKMGLLMNYPDGLPDVFEYALPKKDNENEYEWTELKLEGSWFPEAFIGAMSNLMRYKEGSDSTLSASVQDVLGTMKVVEACYVSSKNGGISFDEV
ncbi:hypothetical protein D9M71_817620 [compost metagenome]